MVAWLSHAGTLIRAPPEHLRMATPLETKTFDTLYEACLLKTKDMATSRYVDLGNTPTPAEERHASHMQTDEPPPEPSDAQPSRLTPRVPGTLPSAQRPVRPVRSVDRTTDASSDSSSNSSSSSSSSESEPEPSQPHKQDTNTPQERQIPQSPSQQIPQQSAPLPQPVPTTQQPPPTSTLTSKEPGMSSRTQPLVRNDVERNTSRSPSRSPRRGNESMLAEHLKFTQGQNANDAYFARLTDYARTRDSYTPLFSYVDGSKHPRRIRGKPMGRYDV